jgi:hypothetical protein
MNEKDIHTVVPVAERMREHFSRIVSEHGIAADRVSVIIKPLSPQEAIGTPGRRDYALLAGREVMIEARYRGSCGHAFTDDPGEFDGTLAGILAFSLEQKRQRAIFIATVNAVCRHLGLAGRTKHCRDEDPEKCGEIIAGRLFERFGNKKIVQIGFQPAMLHHLTRAFPAGNVRCADLNPENIGKEKSGVVIEDGNSMNERLIEWCDVVLVTGSSIVNGSFDGIFEKAGVDGKPVITFGVSSASAESLMGIERICPLAS